MVLIQVFLQHPLGNFTAVFWQAAAPAFQSVQATEPSHPSGQYCCSPWVLVCLLVEINIGNYLWLPAVKQFSEERSLECIFFSAASFFIPTVRYRKTVLKRVFILRIFRFTFRFLSLKTGLKSLKAIVANLFCLFMSSVVNSSEPGIYLQVCHSLFVGAIQSSSVIDLFMFIIFFASGSGIVTFCVLYVHSFLWANSWSAYCSQILEPKSVGMEYVWSLIFIWSPGGSWCWNNCGIT